MTMTVGSSLSERAARVAAVAAVHADDVDAKGRFPREAGWPSWGTRPSSRSSPPTWR